MDARQNRTVAPSAAADHRATLYGGSEHFAPASEGGQTSQMQAAALSREDADAYFLRLEQANRAAELLRYLPEGQAQDDLWSGSDTDRRMWTADPGLVIGRQRLGLTRADRAGIDAPGTQGIWGDGAGATARFLESTKPRMGTRGS